MYKNLTTNLMVESVDKSIDFYKEILGFSVVVTVPSKNSDLQFAMLSKDGLMLMLQEKNSFIEEYPVLDTIKVKPSISLYVVVDNFDILYKEIKSKYSINTEIHTSFYGAREFAITDVDGYVITFKD